jgi:hypothetical protein
MRFGPWMSSAEAARTRAMQGDGSVRNHFGADRSVPRIGTHRLDGAFEPAIVQRMEKRDA